MYYGVDFGDSLVIVRIVSKGWNHHDVCCQKKECEDILYLLVAYRIMKPHYFVDVLYD